MEWVSAESKLPTTYLDVLICERCGIMSVGFLAKNEIGLLEWFVNGEWITAYGSHWMPLPKAPKGGLNMEWIDADKQLPPIGEEVYVYGVIDEDSGDGVSMAFLRRMNNEYVWVDQDYYPLQKVRCWLKMPPIPRVPEQFKKL